MNDQNQNEELIEGFKKYLDDVIDTLNTAESLILELKKDSTKDTQRKLFQMLHSLKGAAGTYGLREVESCVHKMEDTLNVLAAGGLSSGESISDLLEQVDYLHHRAEKLQTLSPDAILKFVNPDETSQESASESDATFATTDIKAATSKKVMIIADSKVVSTVVVQCLHPYDLACSISEDGHNALGRLLLEPFDVIVSQVNLKLIDGYSLAKMLQISEGPNQKTPIIFLDNSETKEAKEGKGSKQPNWFLINKGPDLPEQLIKKLNGLLKLEKKQVVQALITNLNTIALIDDRENIHSIIDLCFSGGKTKIVHIIDPLRDLKKLKNQPLDVILLDYRLGELNGIQVLQNIRGMGITTPVIFLTYTTDASIINNLLQQDVSGLIRKPFSPKKLPMQIMELLSMGQKRVG